MTVAFLLGNTAQPAAAQDQIEMPLPGGPLVCPLVPPDRHTNKVYCDEGGGGVHGGAPGLPDDTGEIVDAAEHQRRDAWTRAFDAEWDDDGDGMGDGWERQFGNLTEMLGDPDRDGLQNIDEFRWDLVPVCTAVFANCVDHENPDAWNDGDEWQYWNDPSNDNLLSSDGVAVYDSDRLRDIDGDGLGEMVDRDSDDDGMADGIEVGSYGSYPEFVDSDCEPASASLQGCTDASETHYNATGRLGAPGTGDGLSDFLELQRWNAVSADAAILDFDGDGIRSNLLDPDADNDSLADGAEFSTNQVLPYAPDTDGDGLLDGEEPQWNVDVDGDGFVSAADVDSDGDGLPDWYEHEHNFDQANAIDAGLDRDGDLLSNLGEYLNFTDPDDIDSEDDLLLDGEEVVTYRTDPLVWDTDLDGMADRFEVTNGLRPLDPSDASEDPDADFFDRSSDGEIEKNWVNLDEYRYGRPSDWVEASSGPWLLGTHPRDADTDDDGAPDGYEVFYGSSANLPTGASDDDDGDGLNWSLEVQYGSDPLWQDTDGDGLCDGGRGPNCTFDGGNAGSQPGEFDYGSIPWDSDSDNDSISDGQEAVYAQSPPDEVDPPSSGMSMRATSSGAGTGTTSDLDGDGLNDVVDPDADGDGLDDGYERNTLGTNSRLVDTDGDRLGDGDEVRVYGTLPKVTDTDHDGLSDGLEVLTYYSNPLLVDTDADGLGDGAEVNTHRTSPLSSDTDWDGMDDPWEVQRGTLASRADGEQDPDQDGLANIREYWAATWPMKADSDADSMPDGYEYDHGLNPLFNDGTDDLDGDGLLNNKEYQTGTLPDVADSDGDGMSDGWEVNTGKTDPAELDSDHDGLMDGLEYWYWSTVSANAWKTKYDSDSFANNLLDLDADDDQLDDSTEFESVGTRPDKKDTDLDGLTDWQEIIQYGGQYDPHDPDTDDDGVGDKDETSIFDDNADSDKDGIKNGKERDVYGTDPTNPDTDCDGVQDGAEQKYWRSQWNVDVNRLLADDVDGDGILDGLEIGTLGPPKEVLYRTDPGKADTDGDGLDDGYELRNQVRVACGQARGQPFGASPGASRPLAQPPGTVPVSPMDASMTPLGARWRGPAGEYYASDSLGTYLVGAFGVRLYLLDPWPAPLGPLSSSARSPQVTGTRTSTSDTDCTLDGLVASTDPTRDDSDLDGLKDGDEVKGTVNPFQDNRAAVARCPGGTDPKDCDSDHDGLGDALELGLRGKKGSGTCGQKDTDPSTRTDPNNGDTDGDGEGDGPTYRAGSKKPTGGEDRNANGAVDNLRNVANDPYTYCAQGGMESDAADLDTDDDGLSDTVEIADGLNPMCFDTDKDGLSDGLELGIEDPIASSGLVRGTSTSNVVHIPLAAGRLDWPTWQPFLGSSSLTTTPNDADSDDDGLLDGLEDLNHNGVFGEENCMLRLGSGPCPRELVPYTNDLDGDGVGDGQDSDRDGIADGRELLVFGVDTFQKIVSQAGWRGNWSNLVFDPTNPWETDPRNNNTDSIFEVGEDVLDGDDINPRADALFAIDLPRLAFFENGGDEDGPDAGTHFEPYIHQLEVDVPLAGSGAYVVQLPHELHASVPINLKHWQPFPDSLLDHVRNETYQTAVPSGVELLWRIGLIPGTNILRFNLPDDAARLDPTDLTLDVRIELWEDDPGTDDVLDLNGKKGETAITYTISLPLDKALDPRFAEDPLLRFLSLQEPGTRPSVLKGDPGKDDDEDAGIEIRGGDSVPSVFLARNNPLVKDPLKGKACYGTMSCVTP